jgi:hypothetical protein
VQSRQWTGTILKLNDETLFSILDARWGFCLHPSIRLSIAHTQSVNIWWWMNGLMFLRLRLISTSSFRCIWVRVCVTTAEVEGPQLISE